jgi:hypothetical protein
MDNQQRTFLIWKEILNSRKEKSYLSSLNTLEVPNYMYSYADYNQPLMIPQKWSLINFMDHT